MEQKNMDQQNGRKKIWTNKMEQEIYRPTEKMN